MAQAVLVHGLQGGGELPQEPGDSRGIQPPALLQQFLQCHAVDIVANGKINVPLGERPRLTSQYEILMHQGKRLLAHVEELHPEPGVCRELGAQHADHYS